VRPGDWSVVQRLADARLLSLDQNEGGETFAELVHESLSWSWARLHEWIAEAEEKLRRSDEEADRIAMRFSLGAGAANLLPPPLDTMAVASTLALMGRRMAKAYVVSAGGCGPDNAGLREFIRLTLSNRIRQVKAKLNTAES